MENAVSIDLFLNKNQANALIYIFDCYIKIHEPSNKYVQYAEKINKKFYEHSRFYVSEGDKMMALHMYESDIAIIIKLLSTFVCSTYEINNDYYLKIFNQRKSDNNLRACDNEYNN